MADFLAFVTTIKFLLANLATVWNALVAEDVPHELFTTVAHASDLLQTRWTVA